MHARDEKSVRLEQRDRFLADERQVEIARARAVRVERSAVLPAEAGDRAATQDDRGVLRKILADQAQKRVEALLVAAKREAQHIGPFLLVGQPALNGLF